MSVLTNFYKGLWKIIVRNPWLRLPPKYKYTEEKTSQRIIWNHFFFAVLSCHLQNHFLMSVGLNCNKATMTGAGDWWWSSCSCISPSCICQASYSFIMSLYSQRNLASYRFNKIILDVKQGGKKATAWQKQCLSHWLWFPSMRHCRMPKNASICVAIILKKCSKQIMAPIRRLSNASHANKNKNQCELQPRTYILGAIQRNTSWC